MTINDRIILAAAECKLNTGAEPKNVYLGRDEMTDLLKWASVNNYIGVTDKPEVHGLFVYKVNADSHLVCA